MPFCYNLSVEILIMNGYYSTIVNMLLLSFLKPISQAFSQTIERIIKERCKRLVLLDVFYGV